MQSVSNSPDFSFAGTKRVTVAGASNATRAAACGTATCAMWQTWQCCSSDACPCQCPAVCMANRPTERIRAMASNREAMRLFILVSAKIHNTLDAHDQGEGAHSKFKPVRRPRRAPPVRTEPGLRKIPAPGVKSIPPQSRWRTASAYPTRFRWKAPRAASPGRRPARSS